MPASNQVPGAMVALTRDSADSAQLIVCADARFEAHPFITLPAPIRVPSLTTRTRGLPRIVDEYARNATAELLAPEATFTRADRQWVLENARPTHGGIEKATLRIVALKISESVPRAAERLWMAPVSLARRIRRRRPPSMVRALKAFEQEAMTP